MIIPKSLCCCPLPPNTKNMTGVSTGDISIVRLPLKSAPIIKYKGWWPEIEDLFAKGLMVKVVKVILHIFQSCPPGVSPVDIVGAYTSALYTDHQQDTDA